MRRALALIINVVAALAAERPALASPSVVGRVGLVAWGSLSPDSLSAGHPDGRALVTVSVRGGADRLRRAGFDARELAGDIADLRATPDDLRRLVTLPDVRTIEERRILRTLLDASGPAVAAPAARAESGLDGSGTLIALVDTGIDFRHADLRNRDGTTRVAAILDYAHPRGDLHPELPGYNGGAVWLQSDIDATLASDKSGVPAAAPVIEQDVNGHGTHVAGIAASNGLATARGFPAGRYVGLAPGAGVIAVQATHGDATFTDADVIVGCRFAVEQAARLGRPVVANLSLGSNSGPHDGTSDLEMALDTLFPADQPGRALVVAAGNEGGRDQHAGAWALDGAVTTSVDVPISSQPDGQLALEIWHMGSFALTIISPSGRHYGPVKPGVVYNGPMTGEGEVLVDNGATSGPRPDGRQPASIVVAGPAGAAPAGGRWSVILDGRASRWDIWISDAPTAVTPAHFVDHIAEDDRLDMPASAHNAIVVGSFVTRNQWTTVDGMAATRTATVGAASAFSSSGPTADGRFAPDLLAPGEYIVSALSIDASPDSPTSAFFVAPGDHLTWADDGVHAVLRGTSQAAPHVAGAAALLFEAEPTLTGPGMREILRVTARDESAGFSPKRGFGKLDVLAATRYLRGIRGAVVSATASSIGLSRDVVPPGDETTVVTITPRADDGMALGAGHVVAVAASAGTAIGEVVDVGSGRYERTFAAHVPRGTTATITATVDGVVLAAHPSIYFVDARADIGAPFAAGGGCSVDRTPHQDGPAGHRTGRTTLLILMFFGAAFVAAHTSRKKGRGAARRRTHGP